MTDFAELTLAANTTGLKKGRDELGRLTRAGADTERKVTRSTANIDRGFDKMGKSSTKAIVAVTGKLIALGAASLSVGQAARIISEFEASMSKVAAITGATESDLAKLRDTAKSLGASTEFSAGQAADALGFLGMAGFSAAEGIAAIPAVLDLATASGLGLASSADIASNVLSGFGLAAKDAAQVADVLAAASSSANTNVGQLGSAMSTVAPIAASLGIDLETTAAAIGVMSDAGIQGERAGTALRGVLASLAGPTDAARAALSSYNLSAQQVDPTTRSLADIMATLGERGLSTADAMEIFGREAASGALVLVEGASRMREFSRELRDADGAASDMAGTMRDNLRGDFNSVKSAVEGLIIALGDAGLTAIMRAVVQGATALVRVTTQIVEGMSLAASTVGDFLRMLTGFEGSQDAIQRAIDNSTLAMGDQITQVQLLSRAQGDANVISLDAARVKLAHAKSERELLAVQRERARESFFEDQGLSELLLEANRRQAELEEILSVKARAKEQGIDLPGLTQDTASWNAEIENAERLLGQTLSQIGAIRQAARDQPFLNPEDAERMAELERLAEQLGLAIDESKDGVVNLNGEVVTGIDLTDRLAGSAKKLADGINRAAQNAINFVSNLGQASLAGLRAEVSALSGGLPSSEVAASRREAEIRANPDFQRAIQGPEGLRQQALDGLRKEVELERERVKLTERRSDMLTKLNASGGSGAASVERLSEAARQAKQIMGQVVQESVTYADVVNELTTALNSGKITQDEFNSAVDKAADHFDKAGKGAKRAQEDFKDFARSALTDINSIGDALEQLGNRILSRGLDGILDGVFSDGGSGGGFFKSIGKLFSFDGGGFTGAGSRSGGVDGRGGFPAILHPNETVVDHTRGNAATGGANIEFKVINNAKNTEVRQRKETGPDGRQVLIAEINEAASSGELDQGFGSRFGAQPQKVRR